MYQQSSEKDEPVNNQSQNKFSFPIESNSWLTFILLAIAIAITLAIALFGNAFLPESTRFSTLLFVLTASTAIVVYASASYSYLKRTESSKTWENITKNIKEIELSLNKIKQIDLREDDMDKVVNSMLEKVQAKSAEQILIQFEKKYFARKLEDIRLDRLREQNLLARDRMMKEIELLGKRGNLNLILGSSIALAGFVVFGYMIYSEPIYEIRGSAADNGWRIASHFLPRLSLIILLEFFSYFFLKLYRSSLEEIKYYQNELTNIESWFIGFEVALAVNDRDSLKHTIQSFSLTERNRILTKDQTTVELEKAKIESAQMKDMVGTLTTVIEGFTKTKKEEE